MADLKKSFFYSVLLTLANYIFPLITYPYVSRVLGATNIGICNYVDSIVNYFIVFSTMGISVVGVREIAAVRSGEKERSQVFSSLLTLNGLTTLAAAIVLAIAIFVVPSLATYRKLMFLGVAKLIAHSLSLEWFFRGIEEFKYITNRSIAIKTLYVVAVFLFVRKAEDYWVYYLLLTLTIVGNTLVNVLYSRRYVSFGLSGIRFGGFAKPYFLLGLNYILTSVYTYFTVIFLGSTLGADQVGYYTSATKILTILTALFSAFTTVMLPRMSAVLTEGKEDQFHAFMDKAFSLMFLAGIPMVLVMEASSAEIIRVISGPGYEGAIVPLMIVAPLALVIGLEQILVVQVMMPRKMDRRILMNSAVGAAVGLSMNLLVVRSLQAEGSAIVWLCSELTVLLCAMFAVFGNKLSGFPARRFFMDLLLYAPLLPLLLLVRPLCGTNPFIRLGVCLVLTGIYFLVISCFVVKESLVLDLFKPFFAKKQS